MQHHQYQGGQGGSDDGQGYASGFPGGEGAGGYSSGHHSGGKQQQQSPSAQHLDAAYKKLQGYSDLHVQYKQCSEEYREAYSNDPEDELTLIPIIKKLRDYAQKIDQFRRSNTRKLPSQYQGPDLKDDRERFRELVTVWSETLQEEIEDAREEGQHVTDDGRILSGGMGSSRNGRMGRIGLHGNGDHSWGKNNGGKDGQMGNNSNRHARFAPPPTGDDSVAASSNGAGGRFGDPVPGEKNNHHRGMNHNNNNHGNRGDNMNHNNNSNDSNNNKSHFAPPPTGDDSVAASSNGAGGRFGDPVPGDQGRNNYSNMNQQHNSSSNNNNNKSHFAPPPTGDDSVAASSNGRGGRFGE